MRIPRELSSTRSGSYTYANASATYACVNFDYAQAPAEIRDRSILIDGDIHEALTLALQARAIAARPHSDQGWSTTNADNVEDVD